MAQAPKVFTRDATGLVRGISVWDAFWYNNWTAGGPFSSMLWLSIYTVWFPNADLVLALVITAVFTTFIGAMYSLMVVVTPRSGSDYVFVSRTLWPALGLAFSVNLVFWLMMINAWNVYLTFAFLSQSVYSLGAMIGSVSLMSAWGAVSGSTTGILIVGLIIYVISTLLVSFGMSRYMRTFQRVLNYSFFVSLVIILGAVVYYSRTDFISHYNTVFSGLSGSSDPYHDIFSLAQGLGWTASTGFDWNQTITVAVLYWFISLWPMSSAWTGGEIKQASSVKAQFVAMSGGQWFTVLVCALYVHFWLDKFDKSWLGALGYIALNFPSKVPTYLQGAAPYWQLPWVNILINNVPLAFIVSVSWVLQCVAVITPLIVACSRHLFAWSFDRVVPSKMSEVSERFSSPILSVLVIGVITLIGYVFTVYTTFLNFSVGGPVGVMWSMLIISIASIVFMWRKKEMYQTSSLSRSKGSRALMPLMGLLSLGTIIMMLYYYLGPLNVQIIGGYASWVTEATVAIFVIGIAGYYVAKAVQSKRGVPLELVFGQLPPE